MCGECENAEAPALQGLLTVELGGRLSNPDFLARLDRLLKGLKGL